MIDTESLSTALEQEGVTVRAVESRGAITSVIFHHAGSGSDCVTSVEGLTEEEAAAVFKLRHTAWAAAREAEMSAPGEEPV